MQYLVLQFPHSVSFQPCISGEMQCDTRTGKETCLVLLEGESAKRRYNAENVRCLSQDRTRAVSIYEEVVAAIQKEVEEIVGRPIEERVTINDDSGAISKTTTFTE